ncbi:MAG: pyruvate synthase subunit beta, partial [Planctomycetota bacterium]
AHRIPYAATLSLAHREDFLRKVKLAARTRGFRFLLMLSPCPTGWKSEAEDSVELIREAVRCGIFPLYEIFDGARYRINVQPDVASVDAYVSRQRRYRRETLDASLIQNRIEEQWRYLRAMTAAFPALDGPHQAL